MKKLAAIAGAGAMILAMAGPALGTYYGGYNTSELDIHNSAFVMNNVTTKAYTGDNEVGGKILFGWGGKIETGNALAGSYSLNDVNSTLAGCNCYDDVDIHNHAFVSNRLYTKADTGDNEIGGMFVGGGWIDTGNAGSESVVDNLVNFSVLGL